MRHLAVMDLRDLGDLGDLGDVGDVGDLGDLGAPGPRGAEPAQGRPEGALARALARAFAAGGASALDPALPAAVWRRALTGPAADFLARPGKQLRTTLVRAGWALGGGAPDAMPERLALVIELLHAGSLIIDDVEDGSDERRGAPALHRTIGVPLAINTGSWMYFWALAEITELALPPARELAAHRAAAAALVRCHQGQALDLATRIADLEPGDVPAVVAATTRLKTGALCRLAAELGAIAAGAPGPIVVAIAELGEVVGTGLQMLDDLGSLTCEARRAKGREDLRGGRPTWPWAWLAEHRPFAWSRLAALARSLAGPGDAADALADALAEAIGDAGRACIRATLDAGLAALVGAVGAGATTQALAAELRQMEDRYG
jgi:geranylgeranyl pyrophosphate synthase